MTEEEAKKDERVGLFCCQLAAICILTDRPIEHAEDCPTLKEQDEEPRVPRRQE
jgi:hypothetical protein